MSNRNSYVIVSVSAVDVLYASMPVYLYLNPNILGYLLNPLLSYQESTQYTNPYAAQDLGKLLLSYTPDLSLMLFGCTRSVVPECNR